MTGEWKWYFAYGSNMASSRLEKRVGRKGVEQVQGWLKRYELVFNKRGSNGTGKANIQPNPDGIVHGVLYLLTESELQILDKYEGVPDEYYRTQMEVDIAGDQIVQAECYIANPQRICNDLKPSRKYLEIVMEGAIEHGLPKDYIENLENLKKQTRKNPDGSESGRHRNR